MHIESNSTSQQESKIPLSQSQLTMWMGQKLSPDVPLYNMVHTFELFGELSIPHFHKAFQLVIEHYDALRIVFGENNDNAPYQVVLPKLIYESELLILGEEDERSINLDDLIFQKSQRRFELSEPLFESTLIKTDNNNFLWFLNAHHLIIDIASIQLIYSKTASYYQALLNEEQISDQADSFLDYLNYEQQFLNNASNKHHFEYWNTLKESLPPIPKFYGQGKEDAKTNAIRVKVPISTQQKDQIRLLASDKEFRAINEDMSLYGIFSTLLYAFIHRISGTDSLTIGSLTNNRPSKKFKETAGLFIQLLPLHIEIDDTESFSSLHSKVRLGYFELLKNAVPGAAIPDLSQGIGAVLNYIPTKFSSFGNIKANMQWLHAGHIDKNHYMRLQVYDLNDKGLELHLDLNTSLLTSNQVKKCRSTF